MVTNLLSTLVQVMACCLTTPNHYLSQCWFLISEVLCRGEMMLLPRYDTYLDKGPTIRLWYDTYNICYFWIYLDYLTATSGLYSILYRNDKYLHKFFYITIYCNMQCFIPPLILSHSSERNFIATAQSTYPYDEFENYTFKITATSP